MHVILDDDLKICKMTLYLGGSVICFLSSLFKLKLLNCSAKYLINAIVVKINLNTELFKCYLKKCLYIYETHFIEPISSSEDFFLISI